MNSWEAFYFGLFIGIMFGFSLYLGFVTFINHLG